MPTLKATSIAAGVVAFIATTYRRLDCAGIAQCDAPTSPQFQWSVAALLSLVAYWLADVLIPATSPLLLKAGLSGRDINKNGTTRIPESLGVVPATLYLCCIVCFQPFFPEANRADYNAALTSVCFMIFLGFADDVLDLRWRVKMFFSFLATLPLLVAYSGLTRVLLPNIPLLNDALRLFENVTHLDLSQGDTQSVELGYVYHVALAFLLVFYTNSINIYAGVNGLEVVQSVVIACAILVHNFIELNSSEFESHLMSMCLIFPFLLVSLGLLRHNAFPSSVFVGDTYTYFAGMTLGLAGVMGHFSKTLVLFFIPQMINFALSLPQLIGIIPCPRHRLPRLNPKTGKLEGVRSHLTLINVVLHIIGPRTEEELVNILTVLQIICCGLAFVIRFGVAQLFYEVVE